MLILQIEIAQLFQGHFAIGGFLDQALGSMKIRRLSQISFEGLLLVGPKVADLPFDLLTVLSRGMEG